MSQVPSSRRLPNGTEMDKIMESARNARTNGLPDGDTAKESISLTDLANRSSVLAPKKPFLRLANPTDVADAAKSMVFGTGTWIPQAPDALVTFITGNAHFDQWRRDDFRSALQGGFIKLMNSLNLVIFDDGLHYGLSKVVGDVVREEEMLKVITTAKGGRPPLIGMTPVCRLQPQDYPLEPEPYDQTTIFTSESEGQVKLPLNPNHSNYVFLANQSYRDAGLTRVMLEKAIQDELSNRAATAAGAPPGAKYVIPMVAFLFQGELDDLERVKAYCQNGVPVVIMEGCGGLGDVIAAAIADSVEMDGTRLRASIEQKLNKSFPDLREIENGTHECVNHVLDILTLSRGGGGSEPYAAVQLLSVINCRLIDTFSNLNSAVLRSSINSSTAHASPELFSSFMLLAVKCNKPEIAASMLLSRRPWANMELPQNAFEMALLLPGREKFVDFYLLQQFPIRKYLSHLKLLKLFREAKDRQFFPEHVWEGILRYSLTQPIGPEFVISDLNKLIQKLSGVYDYIDVYELSAAAYGEKLPFGTSTAERKAMNALLVFAVLFNRPNLAKVLIKYSSEPLLQALFAESLYHGLYREVSHVAMSDMLQNTCNQFAQIATDILDKAVSVSAVRGHGILTRRFPDFNNKTPLEIAYDTNNKQFVAHSNVQSWLDQYYFNFVKVKGNMDNLKLFLSAILIFPMYIWLSFPRLRKPVAASTVADATPRDGAYRPKNAPETEKILQKVKRIQEGERVTDRTVGKVPFPPFFDMLKAVWGAPAVRFYSFHLFYWMFIILICVDIMLPPCRFIGVDIAVFVLTMSMWCEIVMRTLYDVQRYRRVHWWERAYDLICQTLFNILFFLFRIAPYRYDHPFAGRVILAFGILYYCYRVWGWFYYMEKTIGPLIRMTVQMFTLDLSRWIILIAPFLISTTVIFLGVINPDWPATGDDWRHAFYRGIFTLFGAFYQELDYSPQCEQQRSKNNNEPPWHNPKGKAIPANRCWSGDYDSYSCPTVSFWSYFFVIQYYVFLKLGMTNMLTAFYVTRNLAAARLGPMVWKYHRCRIILDYATRTSLPPPFYALGYIYKMIMFCVKPKGNKGSSLHADVATVGDDDSADSFTYWKGLALEYFRAKEQQEGLAAMPQQQLDALTGIQDDLTVLSKKLASADRKIIDVEESTRQASMPPQPAKQPHLFALSDVAQPIPHKLSRSSPYPGTTINRLPIPTEKVDWRNPFQDYQPDVYTADDDIEQSERGSTVYSRAGSVVEELPVLAGYKRHVTDLDDAISRDYHSRISPNSWITISTDYRMDDDGNPLNPFGRTGLGGRGSLPRWGPNHKVYMLMTSRLPVGFRYIVQQITDKTLILPQVFLHQEDSEYGIGCQILNAFLFDSNNLTPNQDTQSVNSLPEMQKVVEQVLKARLTNVIANLARRPITLRELYRGYCDSPVNTDNAWLEVVVFHLNLPAFGINRFTNYKWQVYSPESGLSGFDGAIVRQLALEYAA